MKLGKVKSLLLIGVSSFFLIGSGFCQGEMLLEMEVSGARSQANLMPQWTPDGSKIVFSGTRGIHVVGSDGSSLRTISRDDVDGTGTRAAFDYSPALSPDGFRIVYATYRHTHWGIHNSELKMYALKGPGFRKLISTTKFKRLTRSQENDLNPAWSPEGDRIAFISGIDYGASVATMAPDGSEIRHIVRSSGEGYIEDVPPVWSPDGRSLAFVAVEFTEKEREWQPAFRRQSGPTKVRHNVVYVVGADGSNLTRLGDTISQEVGRYMGDEYAVAWVPVNQPAWSPDGSRIAFAKLEDSEALKVYTIGSDGSYLREVLSDAGVRRSGIGHGNLSWSPDGSELLWGINSPHRDGSKPPLGNLVIRSDGSGFRELPGPGGYASWSPDGSRIAVSPQGHPSYVLYTVARDGSDIQVLVDRTGDGW